MRKILVYMKEYWKESLLGPLFKLLEASFELCVPLVMAAIIDIGIPKADRPFIFQMGGVLILLGVVGLASSLTAQYFAAKASVGFATKLRHILFQHIQKLSYSELDTSGTSAMITRMTSDINQVQSGVNLVLRLFLRSPFIVFGAMIMAFTIDAEAALTFVVVIPLLSIVVFGIMLISIPLYKKVQGHLDGVLGATRENLTGVRVIRAFNKEEEEIQNFDTKNQALTGIQTFVGRISALMNPLTYILINGAIVGLIWIGAIRVNAGILTQGQVVALYNYMSQILVELIKLANLIITTTKAVASGNRVEHVLEMKSSLTESGAERVGQGVKEAPAVEFDHVSLRYHGAGAESISNLTFSIKRGQTVGIIGGTGSGKSSLVHLIPRFYDATSGTVRVKGVDVKQYPLEELRAKIGVVPQKAVLFQGSIRENLLWGDPEADDERLHQALALAQAEEIIAQKEDGLDAEVEQGGRNFSGGQRQRLTIARALVRRPQILILDDSSSALDFATDARLRQALQTLSDETTVFIVSQRTSSIQHADQIVVLDDGEAVGVGTHEELLESCPIYREIHDSQFQKEVAAP